MQMFAGFSDDGNLIYNIIPRFKKENEGFSYITVHALEYAVSVNCSPNIIHPCNLVFLLVLLGP